MYFASKSKEKGRQRKRGNELKINTPLCLPFLYQLVSPRRVKKNESGGTRLSECPEIIQIMSFGQRK